MNEFLKVLLNIRSLRAAIRELPFEQLQEAKEKFELVYNERAESVEQERAEQEERQRKLSEFTEMLQQAGIDRSRGDYMGMLGTVMNCLALQDFLEQEGQATRVQTAITMGQVAEPYIPLKAIRHLEKGRVVIFGAGAGMPYFSTDTVSIQRSLEIHCDEVLMGKNGVDGVYTADPRKDENAKRFATLSYNRALVDNLAVMDAAALSMARDNKQRIRVFGLEGAGNVTQALLGEEIGTMVSTAESTLAE